LRGGADQLYAGLKAAGVDVLYDDRDLSPGVKFKDADLTGIPYRINVGKKLPLGLVEIVERRTRQVLEVPIAEAPAWIAEKVRAAKAHARS
jgi:prolyl-tRNA synthetase